MHAVVLTHTWSVPFISCAGHTTSWTLFNIATVPGVQDKIAEELDGLGLLARPGCPAPREVTLDDLKAMPYMSAAAKEAMRMLPVVSIMGRYGGLAGAYQKGGDGARQAEESIPQNMRCPP
jgi:hypothetical protein